ncbi:MAG: helix-turn-helix domain-containing protein, partial [Lewinella sp.]
PASMYPNEPKQKFRVGAQVMFNKNDTAGRTYYNGKIGRITAMEGECITVAIPGEDSIQVLPVAWENRKYELNKQSKEVTDEVIGTFTQHPLRLAWAITIHKSQGLTFERVIIDAADAFAHGQVYVALSRCKTFEGIVLRSRIGGSSVKTDRVVSNYSTRAEKQAPTAEDLATDRRHYQYNCLREIFDFSGTDRKLAQLERTLFEHEKSIQGEALKEVKQIRDQLEQKIGQISRSFQLQLKTYAQSAHLPSESEELDTRLQKAGAYMVPAIKELYAALGESFFMSDNRKIYDAVTERMKECGLDFAIKLRCFQSFDQGFTPDKYLRARTDAMLDFKQERKKPASKPAITLDTLSHPQLYKQLSDWRSNTASEQGIPAYRILHNSVLLRIAGTLPGDADALRAIPGIGDRTWKSYGEELLDLVSEYAEEQELPLQTGSFDLMLTTDPVPDAGLSSREITLSAFREGTPVDQIASNRGLTVGTINSHLLHWIKKGDLSAEEVVPAQRLARLTEFLTDYSGEGLRPVYEHFEEKYSYEEIRMAAATLIIK